MLLAPSVLRSVTVMFALSRGPVCVCLRLDRNGIGDSGCTALARAIQSMPRLSQLEYVKTLLVVVVVVLSALAVECRLQMCSYRPRGRCR